jgi:rubrerythrin
VSPYRTPARPQEPSRPGYLFADGLDTAFGFCVALPAFCGLYGSAWEGAEPLHYALRVLLPAISIGAILGMRRSHLLAMRAAEEKRPPDEYGDTDARLGMPRVQEEALELRGPLEAPAPADEVLDRLGILGANMTTDRARDRFDALQFDALRTKCWVLEARDRAVRQELGALDYETTEEAAKRVACASVMVDEGCAERLANRDEMTAKVVADRDEARKQLCFAEQMLNLARGALGIQSTGDLSGDIRRLFKQLGEAIEARDTAITERNDARRALGFDHHQLVVKERNEALAALAEEQAQHTIDNDRLLTLLEPVRKLEKLRADAAVAVRAAWDEQREAFQHRYGKFWWCPKCFFAGPSLFDLRVGKVCPCCPLTTNTIVKTYSEPGV